MVVIKFKEVEGQFAKYVGHEGELDFELTEVLSKECIIDDMILFLFADVFVEYYDVGHVYDMFENEHDYDIEWFVEKLLERGVTYTYDEEE